MTTATQAQYDAATKALEDLEQKIVKQKNIPSIFVPEAEIYQYAQLAAKAAVDAALAVPSS